MTDELHATLDEVERVCAGLPEAGRDWQAAEAARLFDAAAASVPEAGPGYAWLGDDGRPDPARGRPLWIAARMTHVLSLGALLGRPGDAERADHGVASLAGAYRDPEHDGWYGELTAEGVPPEGPPGTDKSAYEHAFVLLAGSSALVAGRPGAAELLAAGTAVVLDRFWDEDAGALVERWDAGWRELEPYRGANANMHAVEAFLAVGDATGDPAWRQRALRIAARVVPGAEPHGWRIPEHHDASWRVLPEFNADRPDDPFRPYGATPGHGFEWSRLLLGVDAAFRRAGDEPPPWLLTAAEALFGRALADGWERDGLVYTTDWTGAPVVARRFHWVACEAIAAAEALAPVTGDERYARVAESLWRHARSSFADPAGGVGWVHELDERNRPTAVTWSGRPDVYHALQAVLLPGLPLAPTLASALRDRNG